MAPGRPETGDTEAIVRGLRAVLLRLLRDDHDRLCFTHVSDGARSLLGMAPADLTGDCERLLARVHAEDRGRLRAALFVAAVNRQPCDLDFRFRHPSGSTLNLLFSANPAEDGGGAVGMLLDISRKMLDDQARAVESSRHRVAERESGESEIRRRTEIIELLHDIATAANEAPDADTAMARCLERICAAPEWPVGRVYRVAEDAEAPRLVPAPTCVAADGDHFSAWCRDGNSLVAGQGLPGRVLESGRPEWMADVRHDDPRGALADRLGLRTAFALPVRTGLEVVAVLEFLSTETVSPDPLLLQALAHIGIQIGRVVERDRATAKLKVVSELAHAANRAKTNFLANMSHDLRTPLNAVLGFSEAMLEQIHGPLANPQYADYVRFIHAAGQHLLDLVDQILDLSRIEARRLILNESEFDLGAMLAMTLGMLHRQSEAQGITLALEAEPALPAIHGDEARLRQALINLLSNALRATAPGGRITLTAARDAQGGLELRVADTGCGMDEHKMETLFDGFHGTTSAFTARPAEGIGLGLPLAKALVELHGGMLAVHSEPGAGTTVTLRLPPSRLRDRRAAASDPAS